MDIEEKDPVLSHETASILAADLSPDTSAPQRLKQMHSAMVATEKISLGGKKLVRDRKSERKKASSR